MSESPSETRRQLQQQLDRIEHDLRQLTPLESRQHHADADGDGIACNSKESQWTSHQS